MDESTFQELWNECLDRTDAFRLPSDLVEDDVEHAPVTLLHGDDDMPALWLGYYPEGSVMGHGWFATPHDWLSGSNKFALIAKHAGPTFWSAARKTAVLLGLSESDPSR